MRDARGAERPEALRALDPSSEFALHFVINIGLASCKWAEQEPLLVLAVKVSVLLKRENSWRDDAVEEVRSVVVTPPRPRRLSSSMLSHPAGVVHTEGAPNKRDECP
jgi:hypothetical protein